MPRHPVFIVGSARSGTSALVDVMMSAGYSGFREGNFLSLVRQLNQLVERHFAVYATENKKILASQVDKVALKRRIAEIFKDITEKANPQAPWFDKTGGPQMIRGLPLILELWPDAVFVLAKRRAIENIISRIKKFPQHAFEYHCKDWAENMTAWRQIRGRLPAKTYIEIEQQDMIQHPETVARELASFLSLDAAAEQAIIQTLRSSRPQQTDAGSAARLHSLSSCGWTEKQVETFLKHCGAEMTAFGYSLDEGHRSTPPAENAAPAA